MSQKENEQSGFGHILVILLILLVVGVASLAVWRIKTSEPIQESISYSATKAKVFSFNAVGDFSSSDNASLVLNKIGESNSDFTLALGDLGYGGNGTEGTWCNFVKERVGEDHPFELVAGNHDDGSSDGSILEYRKCLPDKLNVTGNYGLEYYFDYKKLARVILISPDIDNLGFTYTKGNEHYSWLASTIDGAKASDIPWTVVGMHKNCITPGIKTCEIGEDLLNLLIEKKVDLILQGHEHGYMRSKQLSLSANCPTITINSTDTDCIVNAGSDFKKGIGSLLTISGAGGYDLREINLNDKEIGYFDAWNGSNVGESYGFAKFMINNNKLRGEFVSANGSFTDSFEIIK